MNILVTGSSGFVGRHLVRHLKEAGHTVVGIDLEADSESQISYKVDLRYDFPLNFPPVDVCIHLASRVGGILHNHMEVGLEEYELSLLEAVKRICQRLDCQRLIYTSSINVFDQSGGFDHGPLAHKNQKTPYAKAKRMGEEYVEANFSEFVIIRPTNIFGKAHALTETLQAGRCHVIPELLKKIDLGSNVEVMGDGTQVRNFIHVMDVCRFIKNVLVSPVNEWYNLRSEIQITITELAEQLMELRGVKRELVYLPEYLKFEPRPIACFDMEKVYSTGWQPHVKSLLEGLT